MKILLALLLSCSLAGASTVRFALTNFYASPASGVNITVTPTNGFVANHPWLQVGKPIRILNSSGVVTTNLLTGNYLLSIADQKNHTTTPMLFVVPNDTNTYDITELLTNGIAAVTTGPPWVSYWAKDVLVPGNDITFRTNAGLVYIETETGGTATNVPVLVAGTGISITVDGTTNTINSTVSGDVTDNAVFTGTFSVQNDWDFDLGPLGLIYGGPAQFNNSVLLLSAFYANLANATNLPWTGIQGAPLAGNIPIWSGSDWEFTTYSGISQAISNLPPAIATNNSTAPDSSVLVKTGDQMKWSTDLADTNHVATNLANYLLLAGGTVSGPVFTSAASSNSPAENELATAGWVRELFDGSTLQSGSGTLSNLTSLGWVTNASNATNYYGSALQPASQTLSNLVSLGWVTNASNATNYYGTDLASTNWITTNTLQLASKVWGTNVSDLPIGNIDATGTPSSSTYLRGDGSWSASGAPDLSSYVTNGYSETLGVSALIVTGAVSAATLNLDVANVTNMFSVAVGNTNASVVFDANGRFTNGTPARATSAVNATNLFNENLPVPTNAPSASKIIIATSATSAKWDDAPSTASQFTFTYTGTLSNVVTWTPVYTNSRTLTVSNTLALETWVDISGPTNWLSQHWDAHFRNGASNFSTIISSNASDAAIGARWVTNAAWKVVLEIKGGLTNEDSRVTAKGNETAWSTNGVVTVASSEVSYVTATSMGTYSPSGSSIVSSSTTPGSAGNTVIVAIGSWTGNGAVSTVSSATWSEGSTAMTRFGGYAGDDYTRDIDIWWCVAPNGNAGTATFNMSASVGGRAMAVIVFSGVDTTTPLSGLQTLADTSRSSGSVNVTSAVGDMVCAFLMNREGKTFTDGADQTTRTSYTSSSFVWNYTSTQIGAASVEMSFSFNETGGSSYAAFNVNAQ